jgi:hypothetical protein
MQNEDTDFLGKHDFRDTQPDYSEKQVKKLGDIKPDDVVVHHYDCFHIKERKTENGYKCTPECKISILTILSYPRRSEISGSYYVIVSEGIEVSLLYLSNCAVIPFSGNSNQDKWCTTGWLEKLND